MKAYKVVIEKGGRFWSCRTGDVYFHPYSIRMRKDLPVREIKKRMPAQVLEYRVGDVTYPKFGGIFAFRSLRDAVKFRNSYPYTRILVGKGKKRKDGRIAFVACWMGERYLKSAWKEERRDAPSLLKGTVLLDWFVGEGEV